MQTARDLFLHELSDMLDAEQKIVEALAETEQEMSRPELQKAFAAHRKQTEGQIDRLEQVFEEAGEEAEAHECKGISGLLEEKESFKEEDPSEDVMEAFTVGAAIKVERYEITAYESLISMARDLKLRNAVRLLTQSLKEEQATLKKMQAFSKKVKPENTGMEEREEETSRRGAQSQSRSRRRSAA